MHKYMLVATTNAFTSFLGVCALQTVRKQLDKDSEEIYPTEFMFADGKDAIELKIEPHNESPGWLIAMESSKKILQPPCIHSVNHIASGLYM